MNNLKKVLGLDDPTGLVDEMRSLGIVEIKSSHWHIKIVELDRFRLPSVAPSVFEDDSKGELCLCEHLLWEHNDEGYCLNGCTNCGDPKHSGK